MINLVWFDEQSFVDSPMKQEMIRFQDGDVLFWLKRGEDGQGTYSPVDFWCGRTGKSVRAAFEWNRLPDWFVLSVSEAAGTLVDRFRKAEVLEDEVSSEPMSGNGLWKVCAGDKLAFLCAPRMILGCYKPPFALYEVADKCLLWGGDTDEDLGPDPEFGAPLDTVMNSPMTHEFIRGATSLANSRPPRVVAVGGWALFR